MSTPLQRVVVVGGDAAGMSAASRLARISPSTRVTVFERSDVISYAACGMPYHLDGRIPDRGALLIRSVKQFAEVGIDVRTGHEVTSIDTTNQRVTINCAGRETTEPFDALLLATGARATIPPIDGRDAANVLTFRSFKDLERVTKHLEADAPRKIAVLGAGYIGIELAEVLTLRGLEVTVFEFADQVLPQALDAPMASLVMKELTRNGVDLRLGERVDVLALDQRGFAREVVTASGRHACDMVIVAAGVRPVSEIAAAAGIALDHGSGAIRTDERLQTSHPAVWAAGDCAGVEHIVTGARAWIPLGPAANKQGRLAANSMLRLPVRYPGVVGTALVKAFDLEIGRTGLSEQQAGAAGIELASVTITAPDRAHYYPGSAETTVTLHTERGTGRLIGAQIVGRYGVAGRTNVVATALHARFKVSDLVDVDLGYAPPFAPVWDPLIVAAGQLAR